MWILTSQKYGANAFGIKRVLSLGNYHTAYEWLLNLRRAMVRSGREKLSGFVEVDETYVGISEMEKPGRGSAGKALVMISVEDKDELDFGRIRLRRIEDASADSLNQFVMENVETDSIVRTEDWNGYKGLV